MKRLALLSLPVLLVLLSDASVAFAYRLSAATILEKTLAYNRPERIESRLLVEYLHPALPGGALRAEGVFLAEGADRKRLLSFLPAGERMQVTNRTERLAIEGEYRVTSPNPILDIPLTFWFYGERQPEPEPVAEPEAFFEQPEPATDEGLTQEEELAVPDKFRDELVADTELERILIEGGVNLEEVGLERIEGRICWRIGDRDPQSPAIWIDRETYLPMKMSLLSSHPQDAEVREPFTTRFIDWRELDNGTAWPSAIEIDRYSRTAWRLAWDSAQPIHTRGNPLPEEAFDIAYLNEMFPPRPQTEWPLLPRILLDGERSDQPENGADEEPSETEALEEFEMRFKMDHNR